MSRGPDLRNIHVDGELPRLRYRGSGPAEEAFKPKVLCACGDRATVIERGSAPRCRYCPPPTT